MDINFAAFPTVDVVRALEKKVENEISQYHQKRIDLEEKIEEARKMIIDIDKHIDHRENHLVKIRDFKEEIEAYYKENPL